MPPLPAPLVEAPPAQRKASFVESEWVLATSGTTKFPKLVVHTLRTLSKSVRRDPGVGREFCWGLLYDLNRFAGLQVFFQAILGGSRLVLIPKRMPLEAAIDHLCQSGCNALSATPTMWRRLLMTPGSDKLALRQVTLGGEIADAAVLNALRAAYPMARVVHIYASTEAGVGFAVSDGREGFPVNYLERGVRGVELRVDAEGILQIRPAITGQKYLQEATGLAATDGYLSTGDRVEIVGDRVHFLGRDSGAINVGGNKVQPEEVERVLLSHPAVAFATVLPKQSGIMGALIEARVVLQPQALNAKNATAELREWCTSRLERYKVPAFIRIVNEVDMSETGKVSRKAL
jgi:acyl-CoA synthetase (AMP-forming)/AMP-acid ligase II